MSASMRQEQLEVSEDVEKSPVASDKCPSGKMAVLASHTNKYGEVTSI